MEKTYLNHKLKLIGSKLNEGSEGFVHFYYEGDINDCVTVIIELEKTAKKCLKKLSKRENSFE